MSERLSRIRDWEALARQAHFQPGLMADLCPVSLRQMQRFFVRRFERTPRQWTRELRCRLAHQLIAQGWSSKAVIEELGFAGGSHLSREFRKFYGAAPQTCAPLFGADADGRSRPVAASAAMSRSCPDVAFLPQPAVARALGPAIVTIRPRDLRPKQA